MVVSTVRIAASRMYNRMPKWAQVLVDDTQKLNEYPSFMRLLMTGGTAVFLVKFGQTMMYLDSEKRPETDDERKLRREKEKEYREQVRQEALTAGRIVPPSDEHIRSILERAQTELGYICLFSTLVSLVPLCEIPTANAFNEAQFCAITSSALQLSVGSYVNEWKKNGFIPGINLFIVGSSLGDVHLRLVRMFEEIAQHNKDISEYEGRSFFDIESKGLSGTQPKVDSPFSANPSNCSSVFMRFVVRKHKKIFPFSRMLKAYMPVMKWWNGRVIADICVTPLGTPTVSVSKEVAKVETILKRFPIKTKLHAYGTNMEGRWDDISAAIKAVHTELHDSGVVRISCNMRWGSRTDKEQSLDDKVRKVEELLQKD